MFHSCLLWAKTKASGTVIIVYYVFMYVPISYVHLRGFFAPHHAACGQRSCAALDVLEGVQSSRQRGESDGDRVPAFHFTG